MGGPVNREPLRTALAALLVEWTSPEVHEEHRSGLRIAAAQLANAMVENEIVPRCFELGEGTRELLRELPAALRERARSRERLAHGRCLTCGLPLLTVDEEAGRLHCVRHVSDEGREL